MTAKAISVELALAARRWTPFHHLSLEELVTIPLRLVKVKRYGKLRPEQDHLYLVLEGGSMEMHPSSHPQGNRFAVSETFRPGQCVGWYPVDGHLRHVMPTVYLELFPEWKRFPSLIEAQAKELFCKLCAMRQLFADVATTTVAERVELYPIQAHENMADYARRISTTREAVWRVLAPREGAAHG